MTEYIGIGVHPCLSPETTVFFNDGEGHLGG